jgi:hypothetical protein
VAGGAVAGATCVGFSKDSFQPRAGYVSLSSCRPVVLPSDGRNHGRRPRSRRSVSPAGRAVSACPQSPRGPSKSACDNVTMLITVWLMIVQGASSVTGGYLTERQTFVRDPNQRGNRAPSISVARSRWTRTHSGLLKSPPSQRQSLRGSMAERNGWFPG